MEQNNLFTNFLGLFNKKKKINNYFDNRGNYRINKGSVYIDNEVPYELYNSIPQIKTVVDKIGNMFSAGEFKLNDNGKLTDISPELKKLLRNPNLFQNENDFLKQYATQLLVYGNSFIHGEKISKVQSFPNKLINISSAYIKPELTGKYFEQPDIKGIVSKYVYNEAGFTRDFNVKDILWLKISDLDNPLVGTSPLKALKYPITNTRLAYQYFNVISGEKGAIGVLGTTNRDIAGVLPMTNEEKKEIEKTYRNENGIEDNQKKIHITSGTVSWSPMSYPTRDLLLQEQIDANFLAILNVFGVNQNLFVNSTYDNLKYGLIQTHEDVVQPMADAFTQSFGKFLGVENLVLDYSHLPYLQDDLKTNAETLNVASTSIATLVSNNIINEKQKAELLAKFLK